MNISRRKFIKNTGTALITAPLATLPIDMLSMETSNEPLKIHLFSKHLQFLDIKKAAQVAAELGFEGLDLTVRPKGHVLPENVITDLPKAIQDIKAGGSSCIMMTTAIEDIDNEYDLNIIETAANEGIQSYRANWFKYHKDRSMEDSIHFYQKKVKELSKANKKHNIIGCYQNHAGTKIGASFWEIKQLLEKANADYFGTQYDIRHATVDSGLSWKNGFELLRNSIKTIVLKDFKWGKVNGKWKVVNVPIGEGMVDFDNYFKLLKSHGVNLPVSLHCEYPLGGAEKGKYEITVDKKVVFDAMKKDLVAIQRLWEMA
ncbi:MAG: sugar phosphate isomerase/epimerase family protein [Saprospiraceae bacterium]